MALPTLAGLAAPISCGAPEAGTYIVGLAGRWCGLPAWLVNNPVHVDPGGYLPPTDAVEVQAGAYAGVAAAIGWNQNGESIPGLYAVVRRLEGSGCPVGQLPCWRWNLVARVLYDVAPTEVGPMPTPSQAPH